jgi:hypothetical protein
MTPPRGYWARRSEDYLTLVLFQPFACLSGGSWLDGLLQAAGSKPVQAQETRFAFACEEVLDETLRGRHGRNFVIADIMLTWRGVSSGLVAFEVKRPGGTMPSAQDVTKLETYTLLPSARALADRRGVFLVDDAHVAALRRGGHLALGWSKLHAAFLAALANEPGSPDELAEIAAGITRQYALAGVRTAQKGAFAGRGGVLSDKLRALLLGLRVLEIARQGGDPAPPFEWLENELPRDDHEKRFRQSTESRRVNRWSFDWTPANEV